jgi:hypothetical protein
MLPNTPYRQFVVNTQPPHSPEVARKPRFRESLDTLLLGALSTSVGVVLLIALAAGVAQRPISGWNERAIGPSSYFIPKKDCAIIALVGEGLGLAGILLARHRRGTISVLSIVGTAICLLHIYLFFLYVLVMELL